MRIKILVSCSGVNFSYTAGQEYDVDENIGRDLVKCGYAKNIKSKKPPANTKDSPVDTEDSSVNTEDSADA